MDASQRRSMTSQKEAWDLVRRAKKVGWEYVGRSGKGHHRLRWPATGQTLTVPSSPSFPTFNAESDLARISGPLKPRTGKRKHAKRIKENQV
ncbi:type II toxin-antitoxin system HicA family toxin [Nocardia sp. NPDC056611]|uniref:type II toxin-antitoxin system HicA family toxin n=1 Tax=Nocardia sp. NPDC056611 TaxID=3345877 RepID=UPI00366B4723